MLTCRTAISMNNDRLYMHAVKQDATHVLFTAIAHSIPQTHSTHCKRQQSSFGNRKRER